MTNIIILKFKRLCCYKGYFNDFFMFSILIQADKFYGWKV